MLWPGGLTAGGAGRLPGRPGARYRRGLAHRHSPDPGHDAKPRAVALARAGAKAGPGRVVFLYQDEHTCYRRPSVARAWQAEGGAGRPAGRGHEANAARRLIAALGARDGRLVCWRRSRAGRATLARYYKALQEAYPRAEVIDLAQDNWPVHSHDDVPRPLEGGRLKRLRLPAYAPWANPVEKVWRKLKQEVTHQHDFGGDNAALNGAIDRWLARHAAGSAELLRYVGLHPD